MRILITNDDGVHAHGLKVLEEIARKLGGEVYVVAPESDQSGVAHSLSLNNPMRLREVGPRHFAVQGTPTDCVIMGVRRLLRRCAARPHPLRRQPRPEHRRGRHLFRHDRRGDGGRAARRSLDRPVAGLRRARRDKVEWDCAATLGPQVVERILAAGVPEGMLVNVNFPACPADEVDGLAVTRQGRRDSELIQIEERHDGRGIPYYWLKFRRGGFAAGSWQRHRGARRQKSVDHAAQPQPDRRSDPRALRRGLCERLTQWRRLPTIARRAPIRRRKSAFNSCCG